MNRIVTFAHTLAKKQINQDSVVVDATCGNGYDTLFLAQLSNHVYGFDIQDMAIKNTEALLLGHNIHHVKLIKDSHTNIKNYVKDKIDLAMFNLGYLPGGDKSITTHAESTLKAIDSLLEQLNEKGMILIVIYVGHIAGKEESRQLIPYFEALPKKIYYITMHHIINHPMSPYVISIKRQY
ncbi:MAG: class I SAM-dependent methyltransferase [Candidatus Izimaplasma sp.]|nr:class I SAM-dependent methyltransferase [Candidatus Izimaplasma bacterium]